MDGQLSLLATEPGVQPSGITNAKPAKKTKKLSVKRETPVPQHKTSLLPRTTPAASRTTGRTPSPELTYQKIISGLKKFFKNNHAGHAVLGVSGGLDSALTLKLAVDSLGAENVTALIMPELGVTSQENIDHAKALCSFLKVAHYYQPINSFLTDFSLLPWKPGKLALMNAKARVRMCLLYNYANTKNALVLGTSNKSELLIGYATKYGDMACDVEVIGGLLKTEVKALAEHIGLPPEIIRKIPTAELTSGQTDEADLGATYEDIDKVLLKLGLGADGCIEHGMPANLVRKIFKLIETNKHKTEPPPVISAR